jgi:hypothetical protein
MKKWMMLLAGWLLLFGVVKLLPMVMKTFAGTRLQNGAEIALCIIAIVTSVLVFIDK